PTISPLLLPASLRVRLVCFYCFSALHLVSASSAALCQYSGSALPCSALLRRQSRAEQSRTRILTESRRGRRDQMERRIVIKTEREMRAGRGRRRGREMG